MTGIMKFTINGELYYIEQSITLFDLITYLNYNHFILVVEYNNLICNKKKWKQISIKENDKIEIITIVGGG